MQHKVNIEDFLSKFERWILVPLQEDVKREDRSHFNIFIVLSAVIDNLACIRYSFEIPDKEKGAVGMRYRKFIREYMPSEYTMYADQLYKGFRCKLVHEFQLDDFDIRQNCPDRHLQVVEKGKICLDSSKLSQDVMRAFETLKQQMVGPKARKDIVESFRKSNYRDWYAA